MEDEGYGKYMDDLEDEVGGIWPLHKEDVDRFCVEECECLARARARTESAGIWSWHKQAGHPGTVVLGETLTSP